MVKCLFLLNIPLLTRIIKRYQRNRIRIIWRGYRYLKKNNQLELLMQLRWDLSKTHLNTDSKISISNNQIINLELSTRQYLNNRILHLSFNKAVLSALGNNKPLKHPLPLVWQKEIIKNGVKVNRLVCSIYWFFYVVFLWAYGIWTAIKYSKNLIKKPDNIGHYVYFDQLRNDCFSADKSQHNITNWYLQWINKAKNINTLCHGVQTAKNINQDDINIQYCDVMPRITGFNSVKYLLLATKQIIKSLFWLLLGKTSQAVLLNESIKLLLVQLTDKNKLAKDYLFHNSNCFYRPLWSYEAQAKGSRVLFYFYSTNAENFKTINGYSVQYPWHLISWSHYLAWDKYLANFIKRHDKHRATIEQTGITWFSSSTTKSQYLSDNAIAVFDVQPRKTSSYITLGATLDYYIPKIANQFLVDIQTILKENQQVMAHKRKRKRNSLWSHPKYLRLINQLKQQQNYTYIDPDLAATTLITQTKASISVPFTSTALIAKAQGKPSVYYDPSGLIQKDDRASHGIPILSGIDELRAWVKGVK